MSLKDQDKTEYGYSIKIAIKNWRLSGSKMQQSFGLKNKWGSQLCLSSWSNIYIYKLNMWVGKKPVAVLKLSKQSFDNTNRTAYLSGEQYSSDL